MTETKNRSKLVKKLWKLNAPHMPLREWARRAATWGADWSYSPEIASWLEAKA